MRKVLCNSFSLNMIVDFPIAVTFEEIKPEDIPTDVESAIGHADTANVVSSIVGREVPCNRTTVKVDEDTVLYVAQLIGARLPEGATTLPEGSQLKFYKAKFVKSPCSHSDGSLCERIVPCFVNCNCNG